MAGRFSVEAVFKAKDKITAPVTKMQNRVQRFSRNANRSLRRMNRTLGNTARNFKSIASGTAKLATIGIIGLSAAVGGLVGQFSKIEDAQASFTPLLRSAEKAEQLVERLNETAASTPFQFTNLADQANQLLPVMNGNIEDTIKTIRMLGDTAGGSAQKLQSITRGFTKAMLKGKVDMESLNMIAEAGVPIFSEMANSMGVSKAALFDLSKQGKLTTNDLTRAFEKMTAEGGIFFEGMQIASKTTSGVLSTMRDNITLAAAKIGEALAPTIKELAATVTDMAQKIRIWGEENQGVISERFTAFIDSIKTGIGALVTTLQFLGEHKNTIIGIVAVIGSLILILKVFSVVMGIVNLVMYANPIGLIIAGVAALIVGIILLVTWLVRLGKKFNVFQKIGNFFKGFGFNSDEDVASANGGGSQSAQVVSPADRTAQRIEARSTTNRSEVRLTASQGTSAEVVDGSFGGGLTLAQSGAF